MLAPATVAPAIDFQDFARQDDESRALDSNAASATNKEDNLYKEVSDILQGQPQSDWLHHVFAGVCHFKKPSGSTYCLYGMFSCGPNPTFQPGHSDVAIRCHFLSDVISSNVSPDTLGPKLLKDGHVKAISDKTEDPADYVKSDCSNVPDKAHLIQHDTYQVLAKNST